MHDRLSEHIEPIRANANLAADRDAIGYRFHMPGLKLPEGSTDIVFTVSAQLPDQIAIGDFGAAVQDIQSVLRLVADLSLDGTDEEQPRVLKAQYGSDFVMWVAWGVTTYGVISAIGKTLETYANVYEKFESARLARAERLGLEGGTGNESEDALALQSFKMEVAKEVLHDELDPGYSAQLPPERWFRESDITFVDFDEFVSENPEWQSPADESPRVLNFDEYRRQSSDESAQWLGAEYHAYLGIVRLAEAGFRITIERREDGSTERPH